MAQRPDEIRHLPKAAQIRRWNELDESCIVNIGRAIPLYKA